MISEHMQTGVTTSTRTTVAKVIGYVWDPEPNVIIRVGDDTFKHPLAGASTFGSFPLRSKIHLTVTIEYRSEDNQ